MNTNIGRATAEEILDLLQRIDDGEVLTAGELSELATIRTLTYSKQRLMKLPESIDKLYQLTDLDISNNHLTKLPESIGNLTQLTDLGISGNRLADLPESIGNLSKLTELNISSNNLKTLPESIGNLSELTVLKMSSNGNALTYLPESIGNLSKLTVLDISDNSLKTLPDSIGNLSELTVLYILASLLTSLPESIGNLSQLTELNISCNALINLPDSIGNLSKLTQLSISGNKLTSLPQSLDKLCHLKYLDLSNLQLIEFPRFLLKLNAPFMASDSEKSIRWYLKDSKIISIENTTLSIQPVSLFDQSRDKSPDFQESRKLIENYFDAPKVFIREAKVIFLGDGSAGKTYTIQRLLNNCRKGDYPTKETHGILIEDLYTEKSGESFKVRIWDFGGQDIMHEMHRCFLTDRTCYVVMVDTRRDKQTGRARYWLRTVQSIAPKAPVLLLVNEIGGGKTSDLDGTSLKRDFTNLVDIKFCSSMNASDDEFRQKVEDAIFKQALDLDSCKMKLPESWEQVRQNLLSLQNSTGPEQLRAYYVDRQTFHDLCDKYDVPEDNGLRAWLLTWFNDLGVCFSYHLSENGQEQSADYKILDPMWLTSAVYKIIWEKEQTDDGLISRSEIYRILEKPGSEAMKKGGIPCLENVFYNEEECGYILDIMRMFNISYPADEQTEFIPTLCKPNSKAEPKPQSWMQHAAYRFCYTFLPENILHRLMIYCFANLRPGRRWRKGFWLECEPRGLSAVIQVVAQNGEENQLQVDIYAQKEEYGAWIWLQPLCQQIAKINDTVSLKADIEVLAENDQEKKWFSLDNIWFWKKKGRSDLMGNRSEFPIQPLLELIYGNYLPSVEKKLATKINKSKSQRFQETLPQSISHGIDLSIPFEDQFITEMRRNNDLLEKNIKATEENTSALQKNTLTIDQSNMLLKSFRDGKLALPEDIMDALVEAFQKSKEPDLQATGHELTLCSWKDRLQRFREFLGDAANLATVAPVLIQLGKEYGPMLLDLLSSVHPMPLI